MEVGGSKKFYYVLKELSNCASSHVLFFVCLVRSGSGIEIWNVENKDGSPSTRQFKPFFKEAKAARTMAYSENFFAYGNTTDGVKVYSSANMELKWNAVPRTKAYIIKFSPKETYTIVYEIFTSSKENSDSPNLFIYETESGQEKASFVMKRHSEWEPFFAQDESFFAIMLNGEVCFFENFTKTQQKLSGKVGGFSVSPGSLINDTSVSGNDDVTFIHRNIITCCHLLAWE